MARVSARTMTTTTATAAAGLYGFLARREREEAKRWQADHARTAYARPYPRQRRIDALDAGQPIDVSTGEIFGFGAKSAGVPPVARPRRHSGRCVVAPDDTVTFPDVDAHTFWTLWFEEMDLL